MPLLANITKSSNPLYNKFSARPILNTLKFDFDREQGLLENRLAISGDGWLEIDPAKENPGSLRSKSRQ